MSRVSSSRLQWFAIVAFGIALLVVAANIGAGSSTAAERGVELKHTIQCPVCEGQSVAESNAPIAASIRVQIDDLIQQGYSNAQIRGRMASIYGQDVLMTPPASGVSGFIWVLPVVLAVVAAAALGLRLFASDTATDSKLASLATHRGVVLACVVVLAIAMGVGVAQLSGDRVDDRAIEADLSTSSSAQLIEAQELVDAGEIVEALKVYDEILADEPDNAYALARRGWLLIQTGEESFLVRADELLLAAIEADPEFGESYLYLGYLRRQQGEDDAAVVAYKRFLLLGGDTLPEQMRQGIQGIIDEIEA